MKTIEINGLKIGPNEPVVIQGVINLSPESFYKGSIKTGPGIILQTALRQVKNGADIIDIGAKSTAPYLETQISPEEETKRALEGLRIIIDEIKKPISIDTTRSEVARAAVEQGAKMVNDISGLNDDPKLAEVVAEFNVPIILGASNINRFEGNPTERVIKALEDSVNKALSASIKPNKIIIDPDIGFHRIEDFKWYKIDAHLLMNIPLIIKRLNHPICIGLSRKSFIGHILKIKDPKKRLYGSLGATSVAVLHGANIIRTHDVKETLESIRIIEKIISIGKELEE
ncbi:MAG TPA: dihydropteroate synthase [candidate division Zixibacteria bacterium]|nr:dihydropteroate synthase [candidate division Zixibacteria bacterium]